MLTTIMTTGIRISAKMKMILSLQPDYNRKRISGQRRISRPQKMKSFSSELLRQQPRRPQLRRLQLTTPQLRRPRLRRPQLRNPLLRRLQLRRLQLRRPQLSTLQVRQLRSPLL